MDRRKFLRNTGLALGAVTVAPHVAKADPSLTPESLAFGTWADIRAQFILKPGHIHMAQMFLASHPTPVRSEIDRHRKLFDEDAVGYWENFAPKAEEIVQQSAGKYLQCEASEIALTDSTSMGLSLLYNGLKIKPGDEILTSTHDHYATEKALQFASEKNGASVRRITLYKNPATTSVDEIVTSVQNGIRPETRIVALTWVHSCTGVKIPIKEISGVVARANANRTADKRIYFCVDGVHGFGVENITMASLGCDFFAAGTHKWLFGPRGTGILFARKDVWDMMAPTIPAFSLAAYGQWLGLVPEGKLNFGDYCTAGGFHSFEHRWALNAAFEWHMTIGKDKVESRTHELSTMLKNGLREMKHVKVHTPLSPALSAGINCFEVDGMKPEEVIHKLAEKKITGSASPYKTSYARLTPSLVNTEEEVRTALKVVEEMRHTG